MQFKYYLKIQVEPYFAFIFFTAREDERKIFKFTSIYNIFDENLDEIEEVKAYIVYLYLYYYQANSLLLDRLKQGRNLPTINQYLASYKTVTDKEALGYQEVLRYKKSRQKKDEDKTTYQAREKERKQNFKTIGEKIENMKEILEQSIEELKKSKGLTEYKAWQGVDENIAMCGLVQKNNAIKLAIVSQTGEDTKAVYLLPKQLIALIDNIAKPIIIQAHKEADRNQYQQAAPQIIAHLNLEEGSLEVKEGLQGRVIATKDDITEKRSYKVDIDVLLAYYKIFRYEQDSKDEFEKRLYKSEIYSSYEIN